MTFQDPVHVFCMLLGISPKDLADPYRIVGVDPTERDAARVEDAFRACLRRVHSVQHLVIPAHGQWMVQIVHHAHEAITQRAAMAPSLSRPAQSTPVPASMPDAALHDHSHRAAPVMSEPLVIVRTHVPPYRSGLCLGNLVTAVGALVMCVVILLGIGLFVRQSWDDLNEKTGRAAGGKQRHRKAVAQSPAVRTGGSKPRKPEVVPVAPAAGESGGASADATDVADARQQLEEAVALARQGSFDEALRLAQRASKAMPEQSEGLELIIQYSRQYTHLADQARQAINGSQELNVGPPYGTAQFVEQDANGITLFIRGKHERFTIPQFNGLKGVRFRITRDYLDNAHAPANDLILGACHFLMRVDDTGEQSTGSDGIREAQRRFDNAMTSGDAACVEQAMRMRSAIRAIHGPVEQ